jgi:3-oxoacid CoA-transferase subunit A
VHRVVPLTREQAADKRIERVTVRPRPLAAAEESADDNEDEGRAA